jgi:hypothetical protein
MSADAREPIAAEALGLLEKDKEGRVIPTYLQGVSGHSLSRLFSVGLCDLADEFGPAHVHGPIDIAGLRPRIVPENLHH